MDLLRATDNVLAIHGLNRTSGDGDFLMLPEIVAREAKVMTNVKRYFSTPTPGGQTSRASRAAENPLLPKGTTFVEPFRLSCGPRPCPPR